MAKKPQTKSPSRRDDAAAKSTAFRPLEGPLKKIAEERKREEAARKAEAKIKPAQPAAKGNAAPAPKAAHATTPARSSTLTAAERRELETMEPVTRDDDFFFRRLMTGVVPLGEEKRGRVTTAPEIKPRAPTAPTGPDPDEVVRDHLMSLVEGAARFEVTDDGARLEGRRLDLDIGTWRRVRRGEMPIDARIDLHGKRAEDARAAVETFLRERRTRRDRVVLVIHGRGEHSPANVAVLRGEIAAWLSQGRSSQHVAAFATARDDDGGAGALYVLLRP